MEKFNIDKYLSDDYQSLVSADLFRILGFIDWDDTSQNDCIKFGMLKACELIAAEAEKWCCQICETDLVDGNTGEVEQSTKGEHMTADDLLEELKAIIDALKGK